MLSETIVDLLVASYAKEAAEACDVAEGFIREMAAGNILDEALANAKRLAGEGKSRSARAALRRTETTGWRHVSKSRIFSD